MTFRIIKRTKYGYHGVHEWFNTEADKQRIRRYAYRQRRGPLGEPIRNVRGVSYNRTRKDWAWIAFGIVVAIGWVYTDPFNLLVLP